MLTGEFRHSVDVKGRVFLPAKWRDEFKGEVVVIAGLDKCLYVLPESGFKRRAAELERLSPNQKANRDHNRLFFSSASEEQVDRSGRMTIPPSLRQYAGLDKEVVLIGVFDRAEIWDREAWDAYKQGVEGQYEEIAEKLELAHNA